MDKQKLFGREYFEEGDGLAQRRTYNWDTTRLNFTVILNSLNEALKPKRVLDLGCAKGYLVYMFKEKGVDAYGADISSYAVSCAPQEIKGRLFVMNIEQDKLPFPPESLDLITMTEVVEHLDNFDILMREIRSVLIDGGYVLITTPTPLGRYAKFDKTHINVHPRKYWIKLFGQYGFIPVKGRAWHSFKIQFLKEFRKVMPENPTSTGISAALKKMGRIGNGIRNNFLPYLDYFSPLRSHEIMLFRKTA